MPRIRPNLVEPGTTTGGVRCTDRPDRWVVPPWPEVAGLIEIVGHFAYHDPQFCRGFSKADAQAFYAAYDRALDGASTDALTDDASRHWYLDLRRSITACLQHFPSIDDTTESARIDPQLSIRDGRRTSKSEPRSL